MRATLYQWLRYYDAFHPLVGNILDLHTQLPLSRFELKGIEDNSVRRVFEDTLNDLNAFTLMYSQLREYWLIGEVFTYLFWDTNLNRFTDSTIVMPEQIEIMSYPYITGGVDRFKHYFTPSAPEVMAEGGESPYVEEMGRYVPKEVRQALEEQKDIEIDPFNFMSLIRKQSPYNKRGTSLILRVLKDLLFEDKIREAQYAIADRYISPREIWKVGSDTFPADQDMINNLEDLIVNAENALMFNIVTHHALSHEIVSTAGRFPNLTAEFDWVERRVLIGMFANRAVVSGEGPNYACYDEDTETLTENGFKKYWDIGDNERIATFNPITEKIEYHLPINKLVYDCNDDLIHFKGKEIDIRVTSNHRMWARKPKCLGWSIIKAEDIKIGYNFKSITDLHKGDILTKLVNIKILKEEEVSEISRVPYKGKVYCFEVPNHLFVTRRNGIATVQGNTASVATRVLLSRYLPIRVLFEDEWKNKIFLPVAIANDFYKVTPAEIAHQIRKPYKDREPIIPEFDWRYKSQLLDDANYRQIITSLRTQGLPMRVICDVIDLDYDYVKRWVEKEEGTVFDPLYGEWRKKSKVFSSMRDINKWTKEKVLDFWNEKRKILKEEWYASLRRAGIEDIYKVPLPKELSADDEELEKILDMRPLEDIEQKNEIGRGEPTLKEDDKNGILSWATSGGLDRKVKIAKKLYEDSNKRKVDNAKRILEISDIDQNEIKTPKEFVERNKDKIEELKK